MRVFLTGATGYIGHAVFDALQRAQHEVTVLVRDPERADALAARGALPVLGDLTSPKTVNKHGAGFDAYVHAAWSSSPHGITIDRQAIDTLLNLARASARHRPVTFLYTSGVWVLGPCPQPVDETAPVNPIPYSKWRADHEAEVVAANADGVRTAVIRPGIVYGGARGIVGALVRDADNGLIRVVGDGKNHWPLVYDHDLGDLYARVLGAPSASGIFHATDESDERVEDIVAAIVAAAPQPPSVRNVPLEEMQKKLGGYADALALDQIVRSPRARALGWAPSARSLTANAPGLFEEYRRDAQSN
jgi:nucleoside-diphosphate-sugar epimerase